MKKNTRRKVVNTLGDNTENKLTFEPFGTLKLSAKLKNQVSTNRSTRKRRSTTKSENPVAKTKLAPAKSKRNNVFRRRSLPTSGQLKRLEKTWSFSSFSTGSINLRLTQSEAIEEALSRTRRNASFMRRVLESSCDALSRAAIPNKKANKDCLPRTIKGRNSGLLKPKPRTSKNVKEISSQTKTKTKFFRKRKREVAKRTITEPNSMARIRRTFDPTFTNENEFFEPFTINHKININARSPMMACRNFPPSRRPLAEFDAQVYPVSKPVQKSGASGDQVRPQSNTNWQPLVIARAYFTGIGGHGTLRMMNPTPGSRFNVFNTPGLKARPPDFALKIPYVQAKSQDRVKEIPSAKPQPPVFVQAVNEIKNRIPEFASNTPRVKHQYPDYVLDISDAKTQPPELVKHTTSGTAHTRQCVQSILPFKVQSTGIVQNTSSVKSQFPHYVRNNSFVKPQIPQFVQNIHRVQNTQPPEYVPDTSRATPRPSEFFNRGPKERIFPLGVVQVIPVEKSSQALQTPRLIHAVSSRGFNPSITTALAFQVDESRAIHKQKRIPPSPNGIEINRSSKTTTGIFQASPGRNSPQTIPIWCGRVDKPVGVQQKEPVLIGQLDPTKVSKTFVHQRSGLTLPQEASAQKKAPPPPKLSLGQRFSQCILKLFPRKSSSLTPNTELLSPTSASKNAFELLERIRLDITKNTQPVPLSGLQLTPSTGKILERIEAVSDLTRDVTPEVYSATTVPKKIVSAISNLFAMEKSVKSNSNPPKESGPLKMQFIEFGHKRYLFRDLWQGTRTVLNKENRVLPLPSTRIIKPQTGSRNLSYQLDQ